MTTHRLSHLRRGRQLGVAICAVVALVLLSTGSALADPVTARPWGLVVSEAAVPGPQVAPDAEAYARPVLVASKEAVYDWLEEVDASWASTQEKETSHLVRPAWEDHVAWDDRLVPRRSTATREGDGDLTGGISIR